MTILHYPLYWLGCFLCMSALVLGAMLADSLRKKEIEIVRKERE